jgi:hypothetical protein
MTTADTLCGCQPHLQNPSATATVPATRATTQLKKMHNQNANLPAVHCAGKLLRRANYVFLLSIFLCSAFYFLSCKGPSPKPGPPLVTIDMQTMGIARQEQFREVHNKKALPAKVVKWFAGDIADPGENYRATDVGDSRLPTRRLLVAGVSPNYCIVNYERGGLAHGYVVIVFSLADAAVKPLWTGASGEITNLSELKTAIESGKLVRETGTIW